jgi:hypothetical protein
MPQPLYHRENSPLYPLYRGRVGPRAGMDVTENRNLLPLPEIPIKLVYIYSPSFTSVVLNGGHMAPQAAMPYF